MPVIRCKNGKWKVGTGACIYETKEQAVKVYQAILASGKYVDSNKVSYDYDEVLSKKEYQDKAKKDISEGKTVYIISARREINGMLSTAENVGIPRSRIYATGSNKEKVRKIKDLNIGSHYDNNTDVIKELQNLNIKGIQV